MNDTQHYATEVEFGDCDPAGIVYFPNYFRWMDAASRHYFRAYGLPEWRELTPHNGIIGTPLVDTQARFLRPARYGQRIEVRSRISEWRQKSFVMTHSVHRGDELLLECTEVRVFATRHPEDPERIKAVALPEALRALLPA
ncbi:acyl-CoA thioesterase [Azoarcus indigens]|uniref:4-hydroxybenzoyl-CoA thioesterase n=1 Tax=Azoarcus indigens TaxID=29545 RepID=A0A4R6EFU4_9RHOO|nr:acyl-CoA thioesterase [Azoarcus indigens]NMG67340.1 acyl-CoA thioesterase [Azoarcus indigens]TDN57160.1 4-hydroxybenzoyl-CoA thioesterase [Azoarcus indigens]